MEIKEVLKIAMDHEKKAADNYWEFAKQADDTDSRLLFEQLARDEENHYRQLQSRLNAYKLLES